MSFRTLKLALAISFTKTPAKVRSKIRFRNRKKSFLGLYPMNRQINAYTIAEMTSPNKRISKVNLPFKIIQKIRNKKYISNVLLPVVPMMSAPKPNRV